MLPGYLAKAVPSPQTNRAPWYVGTAPSYAAVFLCIGFHQSIAEGTINRAGVGVFPPAVADILSYALY